MSHHQSRRFALVIATLALLASSLGAAAKPADHTTSNVWHWDSGALVEGATSKLVRTDNGISMNIRTSELAPGAVHTVWWVIFNYPDACNANGCNEDDFGNPDVMASVFYAAGNITGGSGQSSFAAHLKPGYPGDPDGVEVMFGPGLLEPRTADVHLVIRTHGEPIPGIVDGMIHSFGVGCPGSPVDPGPNTCANVQFAVHEAS